MKKSLALVSFLVFALACAAPPTNRDVASDTNRNDNLVANKPAATALTEADAIAKEQAIWDTIKNKDYVAFASMLADNQVEVVGEGTHDKAATVAAVKDFEPSEIKFSDWKYLPINNNLVLLSYTVNVKGKYKGKEFPADNARASSAWMNRDGKWVAVYHQESTYKQPPPPPRAKPAATTATPSPATPAQIPIGNDPIANEKAVWDAIKAKNYEGFGAVLRPDAIDVEPVGVFDKAGILKSVSEFDFSKSELSDFKATSFDADSTLVTYVVTMPAPMPAERHSTIWSRRDGKWMAAFHQGTEIPKNLPAK